MAKKEIIKQIVKSFFDIKFWGVIYGNNTRDIVDFLRDLLEKEYIEYIYIPVDIINLEEEIKNLVIKDYTVLILDHAENIIPKDLEKLYKLYKQTQNLNIILVGNYKLEDKLKNLKNKNIFQSINYFLEYSADTNKPNNKNQKREQKLKLPNMNKKTFFFLVFSLIFVIIIYLWNNENNQKKIEKNKLKSLPLESKVENNIDIAKLEKKDNDNNYKTLNDKDILYKICNYINIEEIPTFIKDFNIEHKDNKRIKPIKVKQIYPEKNYYILYLFTSHSLKKAKELKEMYEKILNKKVALLKVKQGKYYSVALLYEGYKKAKKEKEYIKSKLNIKDIFLTKKKCNSIILDY
ncbi:hypothetical protein [Hydrogenothermus marinus]|uniref:Sporulation related protein n=1 Tax=Hydrogenothermus marinus TaxID=133270 RepID=A0A3M0BJZ4_9AQUI|nr:hypothetical protein [Hydrogenothermus marinus]RMA97531.1 hypothetical protein CLV39_0145 [Hydrogenothermus marinus]